MNASNQNQTVVPFIVQLLVEVPAVSQISMAFTGTATGSDHTPGDNDKD